MSKTSSTNSTLAEARKILEEYSCIEIKTADSPEEKARLRSALLQITAEADWENLGVCAKNTEEGFTVLASYVKGLGYIPNFDPKEIPEGNEPVYIKFNTQKLSYFQDSYTGDYRGVLVSCQSEEDSIAGTYGHLPLDLFS